MRTGWWRMGRMRLGLLVLGMLMGLSTAIAVEALAASGGREEGGPWRLAYVEGGPYGEYSDSMRALFHALFQMGWLPESPAAELKTSRELWTWAAALEAPRLSFPEENYYTCDWENARRPLVQARLYQDLKAKKADLVLAMGTWAGQDLSKEDPGVPVLVMAVSDAVGAGLFRDGRPGDPSWLHARMDPRRYERQVRIFHDTVGFERLGLVFKDTVAGRSYAALDTVRAVGEERGFQVLTCAIPDGREQTDEEALLLDCYARLGREVDALYVTAQKSLNAKTLPLLVEAALKDQIPTFSQSGSDEVRMGLLMSISQVGFFYVGDFSAKILVRILSGERPGTLPMIFEDPPKIAINLSTAMEIGYDAPVDILVAADEIFQHIPR